MQSLIRSINTTLSTDIGLICGGNTTLSTDIGQVKKKREREIEILPRISCTVHSSKQGFK